MKRLLIIDFSLSGHRPFYIDLLYQGFNRKLKSWGIFREIHSLSESDKNKEQNSEEIVTKHFSSRLALNLNLFSAFRNNDVLVFTTADFVLIPIVFLSIVFNKCKVICLVHRASRSVSLSSKIISLIGSSDSLFVFTPDKRLENKMRAEGKDRWLNLNTYEDPVYGLSSKKVESRFEHEYVLMICNDEEDVNCFKKLRQINLHETQTIVGYGKPFQKDPSLGGFTERLDDVEFENLIRNASVLVLPTNRANGVSSIFKKALFLGVPVVSHKLSWSGYCSPQGVSFTEVEEIPTAISHANSLGAEDYEVGLSEDFQVDLWIDSLNLRPF